MCAVNLGKCRQREIFTERGVLGPPQALGIGMTTTESCDAPAGIWFTRCGGATASTIAIRDGWLRDEFARDDTVIRSLENAPTLGTRNSHFDHHLAGLFREGGNIPPIWARARGQETAVVGIAWVDEYQGILVRSDSNIHSPEDLKGKRLALPQHDVPVDFLRAAALKAFISALGLVGLTGDDAQFVNIPGGLIDSGKQGASIPSLIAPLIDALDRGDIDAVFVRQGLGVALSRQPRFRALIDVGRHPDPAVRVNNGTPRLITVGKALVDARPDLVVRYLATLLRAADWAADNPQAAARLVAAEAGTPDDTQSIIDGHGEAFADHLRPNLSQAYVDGLTVQKDFLFRHGFLDNDFDIETWILRTPLAEAERLVATLPTNRN